MLSKKLPPDRTGRISFVSGRLLLDLRAHHPQHRAHLARDAGLSRRHPAQVALDRLELAVVAQFHHAARQRRDRV